MASGLNCTGEVSVDCCIHVDFVTQLLLLASILVEHFTYTRHEPKDPYLHREFPKAQLLGGPVLCCITRPTLDVLPPKGDKRGGAAVGGLIRVPFHTINLQYTSGMRSWMMLYHM